MDGGDENFEESFHAKVFDHNHLAVNIDLVNRHGDIIETSIGHLTQTSVNGNFQSLKIKEKGDREFLDEVGYLKSLKEMVSDYPFYCNKYF
jgi:hypothetical protein